MFLDIFQYSFIVRGLEAGVIIAIIAPLIGIFLVLRRYSLIADTLSHVSLAGIAISLLLGLNPIITALATTIIASLGIEKLRTSRKIYGETALALFLSGSLALAVVILSLAHGFNANLFNYLFGSIVTVTAKDIYIILSLGTVVAVILALFYKELVYITFDEDSAKVNGIPVKLINTILIMLTAITISLAIPIIGVLLIAALIVIPVVTALQLKKSFTQTIIYAEIISIFSVIAGIIASFYFNLSTGGTIVLLMLAIFVVTFFVKK
ncbi:MAG: metal ABC transporter permease [Candidatus Staskawiczbacteria bacterium RIFCSPLOWO2_01_FULL_40_39]|uniref:Metal ABC transporter permease n=1 Tax=Candidatus Staskawiczbacteria bacterium RIFCSPHIGHO2_01_FULL_39_25 TaxID=1802202 RepID=A0A1G2HP43_9BACT|nr:MAG: metal ABC transporter permease [Candidatus Staskawiczbacteria bacterium RIFCSPHIGHO2_01_FULL_39_25]OGZ73657.1 MAG: metal ABC transporter permease [Candidatus Staskawiczbacteria bacterium RIFCSPLOWO2_01_FULL_40_39]